VDRSAETAAGIISSACAGGRTPTGKAQSQGGAALRVKCSRCIETLLRLKSAQRLLRLRRHDAVDRAGVLSPVLERLLELGDLFAARRHTRRASRSSLAAALS